MFVPLPRPTYVSQQSKQGRGRSLKKRRQSMLVTTKCPSLFASMYFEQDWKHFLEKLEMCKLIFFFKKNQVIIQSIISVSVCINV